MTEAAASDAQEVTPSGVKPPAQQQLPAEGEASAETSKETIPQPQQEMKAPVSGAKEETTSNTSSLSNKKRKLSEDAANASTAPPPLPVSNNKPAEASLQQQQQQHSFDLEDYSIIPQTVRDLLTLLQLYGALTAGQLEYNLPVNNSPSLIQDVLEVLVCIGLVQKVQDDDATKVPRYCVSRGVPRADPVNLPVLQHEIFAAHRQANRSLERTKLLQAALVQEDANPKEVLQKLLHDFPEIQQDPVYMTALRQCHVDGPLSSTGAEKSRRKSNVSSTLNTNTIAKPRKTMSKSGTKAVKAPPSSTTEAQSEVKPMAALPVSEETKLEASTNSTPQPVAALAEGAAQS